ncbi:MAG: hypothetical protein QXV17_01500 [Candidatus Micrarchaeaceae archaeon]
MPTGVFLIESHNCPTTGSAYEMDAYAGPNAGYNVDSKLPNPSDTLFITGAYIFVTLDKIGDIAVPNDFITSFILGPNTDVDKSIKLLIVDLIDFDTVSIPDVISFVNCLLDACALKSLNILSVTELNPVCNVFNDEDMILFDGVIIVVFILLTMLFF